MAELQRGIVSVQAGALREITGEEVDELMRRHQIRKRRDGIVVAYAGRMLDWPPPSWQRRPRHDFIRDILPARSQGTLGKVDTRSS